jgi:hypothetical protein
MMMPFRIAFLFLEPKSYGVMSRLASGILTRAILRRSKLTAGLVS